MENVPNILEDAANKINALVKRTDKFLLKDEEIYERTKLLTKVVYDVSKLIETESISNTMPELVIDNFDCEQVWAGIQMQNVKKFEKLNTKFMLVNAQKLSACPLLPANEKGKKGSKKELKDFEVEEIESDFEEEVVPESFDQDDDDIGNESDSPGSKEASENEDDILNDPDFQNMSDSDGDDLPLFSNLSDEDREDDGGEGTYKEKERKGGGRSTVVDDQFFKMSEMEKFLDLEDKREIDKKEDSDDEFNMFDEISGDENVMYKDYFDEHSELDDGINEDEQPGLEEQSSENDRESETDENLSDSENQSNLIKSTVKNTKLLPSSDDEDDVPSKSRHEIEKEKLAKKISKLEDTAVSDKPWQMGGEVAAPIRPENSLLAEHLEYETAARHAPIVTEDVSRRLEDIIKRRIKDRAWDDVERKVKPIEDPFEYKKKLVLDQEKSKLSLAQVYEEEYMKLADSASSKKSSVGLLDKEEAEEVPVEVSEIKEMMSSLFRKLDMLTHLHYTPKQKSAELQIVRNIPSINMEEVAPTATSNAALLAPAEVVDKDKSEYKENEEKTKTDKKRERREKKAKKRAAIKEKEKKQALVDKINPGLGNKYSKEKMMKKLESDKQGSLITINKKEKDRSIKTSKSFFSSLQEEAQTHVKEKSAEAKRKKKKDHINIASLKL